MTDSRVQQQKMLVIRLLRIMAVFMAVSGLAVFFDVFGVATLLGVTDGGVNEILGGVLMVIAAVDIFLVPRLLLGKSERT